MIEHFKKSLDKVEYVACLSMDLSKAFDGLLHCLTICSYPQRRIYASLQTSRSCPVAQIVVARQHLLFPQRAMNPYQYVYCVENSKCYHKNIGYFPNYHLQRIVVVENMGQFA